jgi:cytochrome c
MRSLHIPKHLAWIVLLLIAAQLACNAGAIAATVMPATPGATSQSTQAISPTEATPAAATSTGENATPAEAQAMLQAAVQHYQTVGREQALKDFTAKKAPFANRDLYVVCLGADHKMTANGGYPMLVGLSADAINGPGGKPLGQEVWDAAGTIPQGTVPVKFDNPFTGQSESKLLYYQKLDQDVCGVAANNAQ